MGVQLLEKKLQSLPTVESRPVIEQAPAKVSSHESGQVHTAVEDAANPEHVPANAQEPPQAKPAEDPKYAPYRAMQRMGVPLLAIRQKLLLDASDDPSLDVSVLDSFDGAGDLPPIRPTAPTPKPAPKPAAVHKA